MRALRDVLKYDGLYADISRVTTLPNNHDTDRFMSLPNATLEGAMLHTAFMLSTRGIPQLYAGEEIAMKGGHDPDNRQDFAGGFAGDKIDKFTKAGRTADEQKMFEWTKEWIKLRQYNSVIERGRTIDLFYDNDVYIFERRYDSSGSNVVFPLVVFAFNSSKNKREISLKINTSDFEILIEGGNKVSIADNKASLILEPQSVSAYEYHPNDNIYTLE